MAHRPSQIMAGAARHLNDRRQFASAASWGWTLYESLLRRPRLAWLPGRHAIKPIRIRGQSRPLHVRLATTDFSVVREVFLLGEYDALRDLCTGSMKTIVDLGANIGLTVRLWQSLFPEAVIVAVEPDAHNIALAERNAAAGPLPKWHTRPTFIRACAAGSPGMVELDRSGGEWSFSMRRPASDEIAPTRCPIEALTVPQILERAGIGDQTPIDLLKCDIEGAEAELFETAAPWIGRVRHMVVETHGDYTPDRLESAVRRAGGGFSFRIEPKGPGCALVFASRDRAGERPGEPSTERLAA